MGTPKIWNRIHGQSNKKPSSIHQFIIFTMQDSNGRYLAKVVGGNDESFCAINAPPNGELSLDQVIKPQKKKTRRALISLSEPGHKFPGFVPGALHTAKYFISFGSLEWRCIARVRLCDGNSDRNEGRVDRCLGNWELILVSLKV